MNKKPTYYRIARVEWAKGGHSHLAHLIEGPYGHRLRYVTENTDEGRANAAQVCEAMNASAHIGVEKGRRIERGRWCHVINAAKRSRIKDGQQS